MTVTKDHLRDELTWAGTLAMAIAVILFIITLVVLMSGSPRERGEPDRVCLHACLQLCSEHGKGEGEPAAYCVKDCLLKSRCFGDVNK